MKNKVPILTVVFALVLIFGFKKPSGNFLEKSEITQNRIYTEYIKDTVLMPLYIDNTEFLKLLKLAHHHFLGRNSTLFFQFVHLKSGILTLTVYVGKRNHKDYDSVNAITLTPYGDCPTKLETIDGKTVSLGVLEIEKQNDSFQTLLNMANIPINHFVVFKPTLVAKAHPQIDFIQYEIYFIDDTLSICNDLSKFQGATGIKTNPSPPYGGN